MMIDIDNGIRKFRVWDKENTFYLFEVVSILKIQKIIFNWML